MHRKPVIFWLRQDLRIVDNPALQHAAKTGHPVLVLFILDDEDAGSWRMGAAQRCLLHDALTSIGMNVVLRRGSAHTVLNQVVRETGAQSVFWNRRYEPWAVRRDKSIKADLETRGIQAQSFSGLLLREPWEVRQASGAAYKVYTPYSRAWLREAPPRIPFRKPAFETFDACDSLKLEDLALLPKLPDWAGELRQSHQMSERGAGDLLKRFIDGPLFDYAEERNLPARSGTSTLSAYLSLGVVSSHQIYHAVATASQSQYGGLEPALPFIRQLIWRDFAYSNLFAFDNLADISLRSEFENYPWSNDDAALRAWQNGQTGYPIVDAGMRQLWRTGYMHNRVRMIAGSFLTKDLLIHWRQGAKWFWDTLGDADLANNSMGWQWVAGSGIDAAPYFRIFNPTTQAEKFDSDGIYVRKYVPELANLPNKWLHRPYEAPKSILNQARIILGATYPKPIVDHKQARDRALAGYEQIKQGGS